jgi:hypothetical protein
MSLSSNTVALSGTRPREDYPRSNIFDFVFGNPFSQQSNFVPPSQRLAHIDDSRPIFVDNNNGEKEKTHQNTQPNPKTSKLPGKKQHEKKHKN